MKFSSMDTETPEGKIALLCTPDECFDVETWGDLEKSILQRKYRSVIFETFNLRFDSQAMLKLLPFSVQKELWNEHSVEFENWKLFYIPNKLLDISSKKSKHTFHFYDIAQYFRGFGLNTASQTFLGTGKLPDVSSKKIGESREYYDENFELIRKYCRRDAQLTLRLAILMQKQFEKLGYSFNNPLSCASIAGKRQLKVGFPKIPYNTFQQAVSQAAYRGGLFLTLQRGMFSRPLFDYDIKRGDTKMRNRFGKQIWRENGWSVSIRFNHFGDYLGFVIQKPRNEKEYYKRTGYKAKYSEDRGWHLRIGKKNLTRKQICRRWYLKHKREQREAVRKYRKEHPEWVVEQSHKRRGFKSIPLNEWFPNSEAHHINKEYVIFIPMKLHKLNHHALIKNIGMDEINMKAFGFLLWKQCIP